jgi:hypothetical protein
MSNVIITAKTILGFECYSTINHDYNLKTIGYVAIGDTREVHVEVVVDNATGLMWMRKGHGNYLNWDEAQKWVTRLNQLGYAGYQDWRLPTLEEAVSLLEPNKRDALYIDPVFSRRLDGCWTGDKMGELFGWHVGYEDGDISFIPSIGVVACTHPVRSMSSQYTQNLEKDKKLSLRNGSYNVFTSINSNVFHKKDCPKLDATEELVRFDSPQEASREGGLPCNYCNP